MSEFEKTGSIKTASLRADMCRQTGGNYLRKGMLPSELKSPRDWRTRPDPFQAVWPEIAEKLRAAPGLEAKTLLEWLCGVYPGQFSSSQLRTLQRRVRAWLVEHGPQKSVFFTQDHAPGRRLSLDFTHANELQVTIQGQPFPHLFCQCVLTYSNWSWVTICQSESLAALRDGLQTALLRLGRVPAELWTDNSTAATHRLGAAAEAGREFNPRYVELLRHFGLEPKLTTVRSPHENGDVESRNGILKNRLNQHLLLRGSRDFATLDEYRRFVEEQVKRGNDLIRERLRGELAVMPELTASRVADFEEETVAVRKWSTVSLRHNIYSVPSRLIGEKVRARIYEERIEIFWNGRLQDSFPRLTGRGQAQIAYRHLIHSLVRKPGAFRNYRHHAELFPSLIFRRAYDQLTEQCDARTADLEYLQILKLAADTTESVVEQVLASLLDSGAVPRWATVAEFMPLPRPPAPPAINLPQPDLADYDALLCRGEGP